MCLKNRPIDEIYQALFYGHSLITKVFQHFLSLVCSVRNEELSFLIPNFLRVGDCARVVL